MGAKAPQPPPGNPGKYSGKSIGPIGPKPKPSPPPPPVRSRTVELNSDRVIVTTGDMVTVFRRGDDRAAADQIRLLHDRIAELQIDRDAWRTATGLANLTPAEAGAKIDEEDEERGRLQARLKCLENGLQRIVAREAPVQGLRECLYGHAVVMAKEALAAAYAEERKVRG